MAQTKFLTLTGLSTYDAKLKEWLTSNINDLDDLYLKLSGGALKGPLSITSTAWNNQLKLTRTSNGSNWGPAISFYDEKGGRGSLFMESNNLFIADVAGTTSLKRQVSVDGHTHDDRYYTETEADGRFAPKSHSHNYIANGASSIELNNNSSLADYGGFIDFHFHKKDANDGNKIKPTNTAGTIVSTIPDYTSRIIEDSPGRISINGTKFTYDSNNKTNVTADYFKGTADKAVDSDTLDGKHADYFAEATHGHSIFTDTKNKNLVFAGPSTGNAAVPSFRSLVSNDIPNLAASKITSGTFNIARIPTGTTSTTVALGNHGHSELTFESISDPNLAYSDQKLKYYLIGSTNSGTEGYAGKNYGFPVSHNANSILWLGNHSGNYGGQLGISGNGYLYYRWITSGTFPTTADGASWKRIAYTSDIPTSLPASDVYAWAKAANKPSYNFGEIGAGNATIGDGANRLILRTSESWASSIYHQTTADEAVVFLNKGKNVNGTAGYTTSWIFAYGNPTDRPSWTDLTPAMQIKDNSVVINKLLGTKVKASYNLDVNGSANATTLYENGIRVSTEGHGIHVTDGNQTWSGNKSFNGSISLNGNDLYLKTADSTSNDSGDIVFTYGNGNEKCRIYTANEPTNGNGPHYRVKKTDGTSLYDGRLATVADIPGAATQSAAGLMSAADKKKLDGIASGANNYDDSTLTGALELVSEQVELNAAAISALEGKSGLDKTGTVTSITPGTGLTGTSKNEAITTSGTINLKTATSSEIGGIAIGYTQSGKNYPVQLSGNKAYVNVPWTEYTHPTNGANATKGPTANVTGTNNATIKVPKITVDSLGHVTALSEYTYTSKNTTYSAMTGATASAAGTEGLVPAPDKGNEGLFLRGDGKWGTPTDTNTTNTAGATNTSSKIFLIGATSQDTNPVTYSHDTVYVDTSGNLNSNSAIVGGTVSTYSNYISYGAAESTNSTLTTYSGSAGNISASIGGGGISQYAFLFGTSASASTIKYRVPINGSTTYATYTVPIGKKISITFKLQAYTKMKVGTTDIYSCSVASLTGTFYAGIASTPAPGTTSQILAANSLNIPHYTTQNTTHSSTCTVNYTNTSSSSMTVYAVVYATQSGIPVYNVRTSSSGSILGSGTVYLYPKASITAASIKNLATNASLLKSGAVYGSNGFFVGNGSGTTGNMIYSYPGLFIVKANQRILRITESKAETSSNGGQSWSNI